jgi:hypothetical protein
MSYSTKDQKFVRKRERLISYWPVAGLSLLAVIAAYGVWLWFKVPYFINPWLVLEGVKAETLPESTTGLIVVMMPLIMLTLVGFMFVLVVLLFVVFYNERRLIRIIRDLEIETVDRK